MKLHRFYNPERIGDETAGNAPSSTFYHDVSQQWLKVLRLARGERVVLFDGSGYDFFCEIEDYQGETVVLKIIEKKKNSVFGVRDVILCAALVKKDTFEWIVQKATELGVSDIVPILADRSEKKNINVERLGKIITEASEQSGRGTLPKLHEIISLGDLLFSKETVFGSDLQLIAFDPLAQKISPEEIESSGKILVFIGPEGGWTADEIKAFENGGGMVRSLGPQVLRTETAVVAAVSKLVF